LAEIEINLTEKEHNALREISLKTGKSEDELIHEAVSSLISRSTSQIDSMRRARGIWKNRADLPDFDKIRREWDRVWTLS